MKRFTKWIGLAFCLGLLVAFTAACEDPDGHVIPQEDNTGYEHTGVTLVPWTGGAVVDIDNAVLDGYHFNDCTYFDGDNMTVTRSLVTCDSEWASALNVRGNGSTFSDVEVTSMTPGVSELRRAVTVSGDGATFHRLQTHGAVSGVFVGGDDLWLQDSLLFGNYNVNGNSGDHGSAIGASGGTDNVTLVGNNMIVPDGANGTSVISVYPESGPHTNWTIQGNFLDAGTPWCMYLGHTPADGESPNTGFEVVGNFFGPHLNTFCGTEGVLASWSNGVGNVWDENYRVTQNTSCPSSADNVCYERLGTEVMPSIIVP